MLEVSDEYQGGARREDGRRQRQRSRIPGRGQGDAEPGCGEAARRASRARSRRRGTRRRGGAAHARDARARAPSPSASARCKRRRTRARKPPTCCGRRRRSSASGRSRQSGLRSWRAICCRAAARGRGRERRREERLEQSRERLLQRTRHQGRWLEPARELRSPEHATREKSGRERASREHERVNPARELRERLRARRERTPRLGRSSALALDSLERLCGRHERGPPGGTRLGPERLARLREADALAPHACAPQRECGGQARRRPRRGAWRPPCEPSACASSVVAATREQDDREPGEHEADRAQLEHAQERAEAQRRLRGREPAERRQQRGEIVREAADRVRGLEPDLRRIGRRTGRVARLVRRIGVRGSVSPSAILARIDDDLHPHGSPPRASR